MCVGSCTRFTADGEKLGETALKNHIDSIPKTGVHIILVYGGTGDFAYLPPEERRIAEIASKHINGRARFMVQTLAINTADAIQFAKHAEGAGADCLLLLHPYFEGAGTGGVYYHYEKISTAMKIPIMVYNIPASSGFDITASFFSRFLEIDNVHYIEDSTGDLIRIQHLLAVC